MVRRFVGAGSLNCAPRRLRPPRRFARDDQLRRLYPVCDPDTAAHMSPRRFTVLPEERFAALRPAVEERLREAARQTCGEGFDDVFDHSMRALLADAFSRAGADEGTVWLLDESREALVPRFNNGPHADKFVNQFRQTLRSGMISMVVAMEQPICENDVHKNAQHSPELDKKLSLQTCAMLAVPFLFAGELRGVVSCVQLRRQDAVESDPPGL
jgi:hypothetical protein